MMLPVDVAEAPDKVDRVTYCPECGHGWYAHGGKFGCTGARGRRWDPLVKAFVGMFRQNIDCGCRFWEGPA